MAEPTVIGIDVGGVRKGFHAAVLPLGQSAISLLIHSVSPTSLIEALRNAGSPQVIAIDCPRLCRVSGPETRLAERQLHRQGIRVQWTRRSTHEPPEWMENGQCLWEALAIAFPNAALIECFPAVAAPHIGLSTLNMPLCLLASQADRRDWKDLVDACICADVASRYLEGKAQHVGVDPLTGEVDEIGLIYF